MLPAVRHLTVTLSSRELRRFRLVLLLISNECSSLVAATPYRDESMLTRERFYHLLYLFPSIVVSFLPLFLFLSLSVALIARRASLTFLLSTIETVGARQLVRSLARSAVHSPTPLPFVSLSLLTRHPRSQNQTFADAPRRRPTILYFLYTNARSRTAHPERMHGRRIPIRQ